MYTCGEPDIFSHVIEEFLEQKGNVLRVIPQTLCSMLGVYDIRPPIATVYDNDFLIARYVW